MKGNRRHCPALQPYRLCRSLEVTRQPVAQACFLFDGDTYRGIYTVKFRNAVYVLHAFKKKAKQGIATPKHDIELIKFRLRRAQEHWERQEEGKR
ncbi:MAG: type II toxin-antitoxin system RelE/ParE family toxin [Chloroflexi bacterium]|nr:type II toxin-antitoxin system RelE/ParE family toxin [Chloroflexota bacterium]